MQYLTKQNHFPEQKNTFLNQGWFFPQFCSWWVIHLGKQNTCCCRVTFTPAHRLISINIHHMNKKKVLYTQLKLIKDKQDLNELIYSTIKYPATSDIRLTADLGQLAPWNCLFPSSFQEHQIIIAWCRIPFVTDSSVCWNCWAGRSLSGTLYLPMSDFIPLWII